jgi:transcriptional regulator
MLYVPEAFAERDVDRLHAFVEAHGFATLVSPDASDPCITHLPLLLDRTRGALGSLLGHVARGNPQAQALDACRDVIAVFPGPHAYVSPSWYAAHPAVPTWNYAAVHVRGRTTLVRDEALLAGMLRRLVEHYEGGRERPWRMELPADYQQQMLGGIVGFVIEITAMTGKFKLSQNRSREDRMRVKAALERGEAGERELALLMQDASKADL